ncbi:FAD-dependent oxidoreductase [Streptomyces sp. N2-109]|uniref:FAD-dependent oxidoreductase n=1 Tax=Streptomyces gossypii TaxID=2883101 RepID=A0ABT2JP13_9ACTN|nr:NAD(P)/FAD-dependent oxidoreductase [Streptomyces gossypii]MCT2589619.1 FAD-dependent oxidoreductase [Streptomyces gossypii]
MTELDPAASDTPDAVGALDVDVAVIGGGISGLSAAYRLQEAGRTVQLFESEDEPGGRMRTHRQDGYVIDAGTQTLSQHGYAATWQLIRDLGMDSGEVVKIKSLVSLWRGGKAHPGVGHWYGSLSGGGLTMRGSMALTRATMGLLPKAKKFDVRRPADSPVGVQTVAEFGRPYGKEVTDYVLQPGVGTAWGWDPERTCAAPLLSTMIATRGLMGWRAYRDGMDALARKLAERVSVTYGRELREVKELATGAELVFADGDRLTARHVLLALPAPQARRLYPSMPEDEKAFVDAAGYAPMIRVSCLLDKPLEFARRGITPHTYTLLLPSCEDDTLSGITLEHNKTGNRAPAGKGLVTLLTTPRVTAELMERPDSDVLSALLPGAEKYLPGFGKALRSTLVHRFPYAAAEATPESASEQAAFLRRPARTIEYAGDWVYQRPTSEAAVQSADLAVARITGAR